MTYDDWIQVVDHALSGLGGLVVAVLVFLILVKLFLED